MSFNNDSNPASGSVSQHLRHCGLGPWMKMEFRLFEVNRLAWLCRLERDQNRKSL